MSPQQSAGSFVPEVVPECWWRRTSQQEAGALARLSTLRYPEWNISEEQHPATATASKIVRPAEPRTGSGKELNLSDAYRCKMEVSGVGSSWCCSQGKPNISKIIWSSSVSWNLAAAVEWSSFCNFTTLSSTLVENRDWWSFSLYMVMGIANSADIESMTECAAIMAGAKGNFGRVRKPVKFITVSKSSSSSVIAVKFNTVSSHSIMWPSTVYLVRRLQG